MSQILLTILSIALVFPLQIIAKEKKLISMRKLAEKISKQKLYDRVVLLITGICAAAINLYAFNKIVVHNVGLKTTALTIFFIFLSLLFSFLYLAIYDILHF